MKELNIGFLIHFEKKKQAKTCKVRKLIARRKRVRLKKKDIRYENDEMKNERFYQNYSFFFNFGEVFAIYHFMLEKLIK